MLTILLSGIIFFTSQATHGQESKPPANRSQSNHEIQRAKNTNNSIKDAKTIFEQRILPIAKADRSSSCTQCHFAGVELREYIFDDQARTFTALKTSGLIDTDHPDESKLLKFIGRKPEKPDPLIEKVRNEEFHAFRDWIRAAVNEPEIQKSTEQIKVGTTLPPEVIRHARRDRVMASFIDSIWSEMGRCINCHSPEKNRQKIGRDGFTKEKVDAISWIVPNDPAATLHKLTESGNIDFDDPENSPFLTKPAGLEKHGGGPKFLPGSQSYRNFAGFLADYSAIMSGKYKKTKDLPKDSAEFFRLSEQQMRITDIPSKYDGMALQVDFYRKDAQTGEVSKDRWATGFSKINGKQHVWQNPILVAAPTGSARASEFRKHAMLPPGEYVARLLVDQDGKTHSNPAYELNETAFVGEIRVNGDWKPGYQPPKIVVFPKSNQ